MQRPPAPRTRRDSRGRPTAPSAQPRPARRPASGGSYRHYQAAPPGRAPIKKRRRFRPLRLLLLLLLLLVIAIAAVAAIFVLPGYKTLDRAVRGANHRLDSTGSLAQDAGMPLRTSTTLLVLGVDTKTPGEPARSDTIMLMRFDPKTHTVNQLSIPRDTRVQLENGTYDKINTAMFWGGPMASVRAIQRYLGVEVNHVVVMNFTSLYRLVNAVGGVDIDVPQTISSEYGPEGARYTIVFEKGKNHLDGKRALQYVRIRYADDDFHRAARQQAFLQALTAKLTSRSLLPRLPEIGASFMETTATDLTTPELLQLAYVKQRAKGGKKAVLAGTPQYIGGVAYVLPPDEAAKQAAVNAFLGR